jgi:hypothetical protein
LVPFNTASCSSQTLYLLIKRIDVLVQPRHLRFWQIGPAQLVERFADVEFSCFCHGSILCVHDEKTRKRRGYLKFMGKSVLRLRFALRLRRNAQRAFNAPSNASYGATNDAAHSAPDRTCRLAPCFASFLRSLTCALLSATDDALRICNNRHC